MGLGRAVSGRAACTCWLTFVPPLRLRGRVALGGLGADRQPGKAQPVQQLAHRALVELHAPAFTDHPAQVHPAPAHDLIDRRIRSRLDDLGQLGQLLGREPTGWPRRHPVGQTR